MQGRQNVRGASFNICVRAGQGGGGVGGGGAPKIFGQLRFFGQQGNFGQIFFGVLWGNWTRF